MTDSIDLVFWAPGADTYNDAPLFRLPSSGPVPVPGEVFRLGGRSYVVDRREWDAGFTRTFTDRRGAPVCDLHVFLRDP